MVQSRAIVHRIGKGWTIEMIVEWKRRLITPFNDVVKKRIASSTQFVASVEVENCDYP